MLTILGLVAVGRLALPRHPAARHLDLGDELRADVRARARHRLRAVHRASASAARSSARGCRPRTRSPRRWTPPARPCCSRGVTVLISLTRRDARAQPGVPLDGLGIMLSVVFVLAATLTLLPAVLGQARPAGRQARAAVGALRRAPLAALRAPGASACGGGRSPTASRALVVLARARAPGARPEDRHAVDQGRARPATARASGYDAGPGGVRRRARPARCRSSRPPARGRSACRGIAKADPGIAQVMPRRSPAPDGCALVQAIPDARPVEPRPSARPIDRLRAAAARRARWSAAPWPRTTTSRQRCRPRRRW